MQPRTCADLAAVKSRAAPLRAARVCRSRVIKYERIELREQVRCEQAQVNTRASPSETENPEQASTVVRVSRRAGRDARDAAPILSPLGGNSRGSCRSRDTGRFLKGVNEITPVVLFSDSTRPRSRETKHEPRRARIVIPPGGSRFSIIIDRAISRRVFENIPGTEESREMKIIK